MNLFIVLLSIVYAFEFIGIFTILSGTLNKIEINAFHVIPIFGIHLLFMYAGGFFDQFNLPQYIILGLFAWGLIDTIRLHDTVITKFNPLAMFFLWFAKVIALYQGLP